MLGSQVAMTLENPSRLNAFVKQVGHFSKNSTLGGADAANLLDRKFEGIASQFFTNTLNLTGESTTVLMESIAMGGQVR